MPFPVADHAELREQYADDSNLGARRSIYVYGRPRADLPAAVLDLADLIGTELIVDVGCGPGTYLAALRARGHTGRLLALDLSTGMLDTARARDLALSPVNADVIALPLRESAADVTIAAHMLYHAGDVPRAVAGLRRVTRPGGQVLVVLNGVDHCREMRALFGGGPERLTVETAEPLLRAVFDDVSLTPLRGELVVPLAAPVLDYAASFPRDRRLGDDELAAEVGRRVREDGAFHDVTEVGIFRCR